MAGSSDNFNSNIALALSAAPQGVYSPEQQGDMDDHFSSTQTLSQIASDAFTVRVLFLIGSPANTIVTFTFGGVELIGRACGAAETAYGFIKEAVAPGEYATVWRRGVLRDIDPAFGLLPASLCYRAAGGTISNGGANPPLGYTLDAATMVFTTLAG